MRACPLNTSSFLSWLRLIWMVGEALDVGGGDSDRAASYQEQMSHWGQTRRYDRALITSGLPTRTDILRVRRHVSNVPKPEVSITRPRSAQPSEAELSPTRASKANVYVIRLLAVLCLCCDRTFSRLRFSAADFGQPDGNRTRPDTSPPQRNPPTALPKSAPVGRPGFS